jgi:hypothetical protein
MDQIEKPLSILLIVGAIAYAFMFHTGDGYAAIENNTDAGYTVEAANLNSGYNVTPASSDEGYNIEAQKVYLATCDTTSADSLLFIPPTPPRDEIIIELEVAEE